MTDDNRLPWFPCDPSKLLGGLAALKPDQKIVYMIVLLRIYEIAGPCPDPLDSIVQRTGLNKRRVSDALDFLFKTGKLERQSDGIMNKVATKVLAKQLAHREGRKIAGQKGAAATHGKIIKNQTPDDLFANDLPLAKSGYLDLDSEVDKERKKVVVPRTPRRAPRAKMREDWKLTEKDWAYARSLGFDDDRIRKLTNGCRNYHLKHGTMIAGAVGLAASWRTWCDNQVGFDADKIAKDAARNHPRRQSLADIARNGIQNGQ